jgi:hypothetical protein
VGLGSGGRAPAERDRHAKQLNPKTAAFRSLNSPAAVSATSHLCARPFLLDAGLADYFRLFGFPVWSSDCQLVAVYGRLNRVTHNEVGSVASFFGTKTCAIRHAIQEDREREHIPTALIDNGLGYP